MGESRRADLWLAQELSPHCKPNGVTTEGLDILKKGGDPAAGSPTATLLRLSPNRGVYLRRFVPLRVTTALSDTPHFRGLTGGVYKAQEHIHRGMLTRDY